VDFILIKSVLSDHLSDVTLFQSSLGMSHKTGLTVYICGIQKDYIYFRFHNFCEGDKSTSNSNASIFIVQHYYD